ncbi:MAG: hypothetical protein WCV84_02760 [Patescibacteria group bacterium]
MTNGNIGTRYFDVTDAFARRVPEIIQIVCSNTGFIVRQELFRGQVYDADKVGSVLLQGVFGDRPAVLKIQGLRLDEEEVDGMRAFMAQNTSEWIRIPEIYAHEPRQEEWGYGYTIMECIDGVPLFDRSCPSSKDRETFARFYQEYRTKAITKPWIVPPQESTKEFVLFRVEKWRALCAHKGYLAPEQYEPFVARFCEIVGQVGQTVPLVFCHGHLTSTDIVRDAQGQCVLFSNLFWSYRPQWYDLAFNVWSVWMSMPEGEVSPVRAKQILEEWRATYRTIPVTQTDASYERTLDFVLLERVMGAILADIGASDALAKRTAYRDALLQSHVALFETISTTILS